MITAGPIVKAMLRRGLISLSALCLFAAPMPGQAATIINGSFQAEAFPTFPGYSSGNGPITGWDITGANRVGINAVGGPFANNGTIPDGNQTAFVQNAIGATGTLSQTVTGLVTGQDYTVTYRVNARSGQNALLQTTITDGGDYLHQIDVPPVGGANPYRFAEFSFTATANQATLTFANVKSGPDTTVLIDAVRIADGATIPNVGVRASSNLAGGFNRNAQFLVNRAGLDVAGQGTHSSTPDGTMWLNTGTFQAPNDTNPELIFDLHSAHDISSIRIWNYNEINLPTRGVRDFELLVSDTLGGPFTSAGTFTLSQAPGAQNVDFSENFNFNATGRFVKLDVINGHGGDNGFFGLSEVQFQGKGVTTPNARITGITIADVSSNLTGFNRGAQHLVDNSGLFNDTHVVAPDGNMWLNQGTFGNGGAADTAPEVTFDLGRLYDVTSLKIWNYNEFLAGRADLLRRGVNEFEILISDTLDGDYTSLGLFNLAIAPGVGNVDFGQIFNVDGQGRYIKLDLLSNHGGDNNFFGLSEVQVFGTAVVPEPASALLATLGMAGLLITRRRRA